MEQIVIGVISALGAGVLTYFSTRSKILLDLSADYDRDLRNKRLEAYRELWARMEPLSRYSPNEELTVELLRNTRASIKQWYFQVGGIYLSNQCRDEYDVLKDCMLRLIRKYEDNGDQVLLEHHEAVEMLDAGKELRKSLAKDVATRKELNVRK